MNRVARSAAQAMVMPAGTAVVSAGQPAEASLTPRSRAALGPSADDRDTPSVPSGQSVKKSLAAATTEYATNVHVVETKAKQHKCQSRKPEWQHQDIHMFCLLVTVYMMLKVKKCTTYLASFCDVGPGCSHRAVLQEHIDPDRHIKQQAP